LAKAETETEVVENVDVDFPETLEDLNIKILELIGHSIYDLEASYGRFYAWLDNCAKRKLNINGIVDDVIAKIVRDLVASGKHRFPAPVVELKIENGSIPLAGYLQGWIVSGGETLHRNGDATILRSTDPLKPRQLIVSLPLAVANGTLEDGSEVRLDIWDFSTSTEVTAGIANTSYHFEVTIYEYLKWPEVTKIDLPSLGVVEGRVLGWESFLDWVLAVLILIVIFFVLFIIVSILLCYFVVKFRRVSRELELEKKQKQ
jgi:hypothetical protein